MNIQTIIEICGWVGSILIVLAYFQVSKKKWLGDSFKYQVLNVIGAILVGINVWYKEVWGPLFLQTVWAIIGLVAIWKIFRKRS